MLYKAYASNLPLIYLMLELEHDQNHQIGAQPHYPNCLFPHRALCVCVCAQDEVLLAKGRYEIGLEKLQTTEESVSGMKEELIALQPQLEVSGRRVCGENMFWLCEVL